MSKENLTLAEVSIESMRSWYAAKLWVVGNALAFLFASLLTWSADIRLLSLLVSIPFIYFVGSILGFIKIIMLGNPINPIAWYVISSGLAFGAGPVVGALRPDINVYSAHDQIIEDLLRTNLLNASSVVIVVIVCTVFFDLTIRKYPFSSGGVDRLQALLKSMFTPLILLCFIIIWIQAYYFPIPENLIIRSIVGYGEYILVVGTFFSAYMWVELSGRERFIVLLYSTIFILMKILSFSKLAAMLPFLYIIAGFWMRKITFKSIIIGSLTMVLIYGLVQPVFSTARVNSYNIDASANLWDQVGILRESVGDVLFTDVISELEAEANVPVIVSATSRFSMLFIQGFLIEEYQRGNSGVSMEDFWVALIPRILWPDKPDVTRFGNELDGLFWGRSGEFSKLAPSYTAEAYWNYGPIGLLVISLLLGLEITWLARRSHFAIIGRDLAYFVICLPAVYFTLNIESWIVPSLFGGFITLLVVYLSAKLLSMTYFR